MNASELFRANLKLVGRIVGGVRRRSGLRGADAEGFGSAVNLALMENDDAIPRSYEGRSSRRDVLMHVEHCRETAVLPANAQLREDGAAHGAGATPAPASRWWLAVAAAVLLALTSVPLLLLRDRGSIHRLVALAPRSTRLVEPRLTGGFPWAAYAGAHRAAGESKDAAQLKLGGAAGEIVEGAARDSGREAQHAAGVALVLVQEPAEAVTRLEAAAGQSREAASGQSREAAAGQTSDPKVLSDLAAARYAAASQLGRASLYPTALAAADAALRLDPNLSEALFNRALTLDRLGLAFDARRAWQRYLQADGSSSWAAEAQARLAQLPATTHKAQFEHDRPLLEQAAARGDAAAVRRYVDANRELARRYAEPIYLGHWGEAVQRNDMAEAARLLSISRGVGSALFAISGDALLRDAVHAIDTATPAGQQAIAAAHVLYLSGRTAYSRDQRDTAERDLLRAAAAFEAAHDPMALQAQYYAASVRLAGNDTAGARAGLERTLAAADAHRDYISFGAYVRWDLGRALSADDDWSGAAAVLAEGAAMLQQVGEREGEAFVETNLANALSSLGRNDDAWLARMRAFSALSAEGINPQRLATAIAAAAAGELAAGHRDAALALMSTEASVAPDAGRPQMAISGLVTRAMLQSMNGDPSAAAQTARQADALAQQTSDPALRASWTATAGVARGAVLAAQDPRAAAEPLTRSIDFYASHATPGALLDPLLLRSRCAVRTGDVPSAMRDLEQGMSIVENHPAGVPGAAAGSSLLDAEHALYTDAIRLSLDRGDEAAAFAYAERSHGVPVTLSELRHRLAGTGTAVLEIVALPGELVTFAVTENDSTVIRRPGDPDALSLLADEALTEQGTGAAAKLYDALIRPAGAVLDHAREVVIVADPRLLTVPFAALYDSVHGRFAVERWAVAMASSAGTLQPEEPRMATPAVAVIALPSGGSDSRGLPEVEDEVRDVAALYGRVTPLAAAPSTLAGLRTAAAGTGVVHIAGHTERQPGGGEQALLFGTSGKIERVSWKAVVASPAPYRGVVVLAACETLRPPPSSATRLLSLGAAFSVAGAAGVAGTLSPIGDRDARLLFRALHRQLAAGVPLADALRAVQEEAIVSEKANGGSHAWRAVASMTRRIPAPPRRKE